MHNVLTATKKKTTYFDEYFEALSLINDNALIKLLEVNQVYLKMSC